MKCCSLPTLGVFIGSLTISVCLFVLIIDISALSALHSAKSREFASRIENDILNTDGVVKINNVTVLGILLVFVLIVCLKLIFISGLLIYGILKNRHYLMVPWLVLTMMTIVFNLIMYIVRMSHGVAGFAGFWRIGVNVLIWSVNFYVYKDIRTQNKSNFQQGF